MRDSESAIRDLLAERYPRDADQRRITSDAGLDPGTIAFSGKAVNTWHAILHEASRRGRIGVLINAVLTEYADDPQLQAAAVTYAT